MRRKKFNKIKRYISLILVILIITLNVPIVYAGGGETAFTAMGLVKDVDYTKGYKISSTTEITMGRVWYYAKALGYNDYQAAGICGNFSQEGKVPGMIEGGFEILSSKFQLTSENVIKVSTASRGYGLGLGQWSGGRRENLINYIIAQGSTADWFTLDKGIQLQMAFLQGEVNSCYSSVQPTSASWSSKTTCAETAFMWHKDYEKSSDTLAQIAERGTDAQKWYDLYKGTQGISPTSSATSIITTTEVAKEDIEEIKSMVEYIDELYRDGTLNKQATNSDLYDLSLADRQRLEEMKDNQAKEETTFVHVARVFTMVGGILLLMYTIFLLLAYLFDRVNSFFEFSLLNILTVGRLAVSPEEGVSVDKEGVKYITTRGIIGVVVVGVLASTAILTGFVFGILLKIVQFFY